MNLTAREEWIVVSSSDLEENSSYNELLLLNDFREDNQDVESVQLILPTLFTQTVWFQESSLF